MFPSQQEACRPYRAKNIAAAFCSKHHAPMALDLGGSRRPVQYE
jgi:hypothetical protein